MIDKSYKKACVVHQTALHIDTPASGSIPHESLIGNWYFEAVEVPKMGIRRGVLNQEDYYFEFCENGMAVAHIHGDTYETSYFLDDDCITFAHADLATLKLLLEKDRLRMHNYLGTTMIFRKQNAAL